MKFISKAKAKYITVVAKNKRDDVALTLLADGVSSELDNLLDDPHEGEEDDAESYEKLRDMIVRPQQDVVHMTEMATKTLGLNLSKYLPVELVDKMVKEWETKTGVPFDKVPDKERHRIVLNCLGHGVGPFDDVDFFDWLDDNGFNGKEVASKWRVGTHSYFETDHEKVWAWVSDAVAALKKEVKADTQTMPFSEFKKKLQELGDYKVKTKKVGFSDLARGEAKFMTIYSADGKEALTGGIVSESTRNQHKAMYDFVYGLKDKGIKVVNGGETLLIN